MVGVHSTATLDNAGQSRLLSGGSEGMALWSHHFFLNWVRPAEVGNDCQVTSRGCGLSLTDADDCFVCDPRRNPAADQRRPSTARTASARPAR